MQKNFEGEIAELRLQMMKANQYVTHSSASLRVVWALWRFLRGVSFIHHGDFRVAAVPGGGTGGGRTGTETSIIWVPGSLIALG